MEVQEKKQGPGLATAATGGRAPAAAHAAAQAVPQALSQTVPQTGPQTVPQVFPEAATQAPPQAIPTPRRADFPAVQQPASPITAAARLSGPDRLLAWVDTHRWKLFAAVIVLYALGFNGQWRLEPDSALYLTIGRNLAEGRGYTYHGEHHHLAYPGLPWLFAATFKVFGSGTLLPAHVIILLCGAGALALTYRLFYLHAGRPTAVLVTVALALSRTFYRYCFELLSDVPFLVGVMAFLVGYEAIFFRRYDRDVREGRPDPRGKPRWFDWLLLFGGLALAMVMRPTMWALLLAIVGAVAVSLFRGLFRRPLRVGRLAVGCALLAAAVAAGLLFYSLDPRRAGPAEPTGGDYEIAFLDALTKDMDRLATKALHTNLPAILHPSASEAVFGIDFGHLDFGRHAVSMSALPSVAVLAVGAFLFRRRLLWGIWVAVTLLMMLLTVVHVRYFLQALPVLLYACWLAVVWVHRRGEAAAAANPARSRAAWWAGAVAMGLLAALVGLNLLRVASLIAEQRRTPFLARYRDGKYAAAPGVAEVLRSQTPEGAWVLVPQKYGRILTYLSGRYAVEPGPATLLDPAEQPVYVLEPMDEAGRAWMAQKDLASGARVGERVTTRRGKDWQVYRATRSAPEPVSPSPAGRGNKT
jgi:hypothetical protein